MAAHLRAEAALLGDVVPAGLFGADEDGQGLGRCLGLFQRQRIVAVPELVVICHVEELQDNQRYTWEHRELLG